MTTTDHRHTHHRHTRRCWFDHREARWVCATPSDSDTDALVDTRDMVVVHTAMLREFRLLPDAVQGVAAADTRRATIVDAHLGLLCDLLHHHHTGEDELLWPVLGPRLRPEQTALLDVAEAQHAGIEAALDDVADARRRWLVAAAAGPRDDLVAALRLLHGRLVEHLEAEERELLPLVASHLTEAEWQAVGDAGAASVPKPLLPLVFGMFAYEGDPVVLKTMLSSASAVPRVLVPRIAPRFYARRARQVYGTATP